MTPNETAALLRRYNAWRRWLSAAIAQEAS